MSEELKPCPFCGEKPDIQESDPSTLSMNEGAVHFSVSCTSFGCMALPEMNLWHVSPEDAASAWNTRHLTAADVPESVKREIQAEALESLIDGKPGPFIGFSWIRGLITKLREGE